MRKQDPIHVTVPGYPEDPRGAPPMPDGVCVHHLPELHADDVDVVDGIPITSVSRTLIDLAEVLDEQELRACMTTARDRGLLDMEKLAASRARVEWRPSLAMLDCIIAEFS